MFANIALFAAANVRHYATATPTAAPANGLACGLTIRQISLVSLTAEANCSRFVQFLKALDI